MKSCSRAGKNATEKWKALQRVRNKMYFVEIDQRIVFAVHRKISLQSEIRPHKRWGCYLTVKGNENVSFFTLKNIARFFKYTFSLQKRTHHFLFAH